MTDDYSVQLSVTTFNQVYESLKSDHIKMHNQSSKDAKAQNADQKVIQWGYGGQSRKELGAPFINFLMSMDRLRDASLQLKIW